MRIALAAVLALAGLAPLQDDVVKKIVPDADRIKKSVRKISKESRDKIEKALGEKLQDADLAPALWECQAIVPAVSSMDRTAVRVVVLSVKGPKGVLKLGVAVATLEDTVHAVKVLENGDDKGVEAKQFLEQFAGLQYTSNLYNGPDVLAAAAKRAQEGKDASAKETDLLLRMNSLMRGVGPAWDRLLEKVEKKDKSASDDLAALDRSLDEALKLVPNAAFLPAASHDRFKQYGSGARTDLSELKGMLAAGKFDDAFRKTGEIDSQRCAKCHSAYRMKFKDARLKQNLGNGYFSTKLEVEVPVPALEASYQAVASGVHKAVLLAEEAK